MIDSITIQNKSAVAELDQIVTNKSQLTNQSINECKPLITIAIIITNTIDYSDHDDDYKH